MSGIKTTVGCCGANIYNRTVINAEDVDYDNSALLYPMGTNDVQSALDLAGAAAGGEVCSIRAGIDPTSAPGPIGGLLVTAAQTAAFNYLLPFTVTTGGLDIADPYQTDPNGLITLSGAPGLQDTFTINQSAAYEFELNFFTLSTAIIPLIGVQLLRTGGTMFSGPTILSSFCSTMLDMTSTPVGGIYGFSCVLCGAAQANLTAGDQLSLAMYVSSGTVEIPLTAALSISIAQAAGPQGAIGPAGPAFSTPMAPTVRGLAFGEQNSGRNFLGENVNSTPLQATGLYAGVVPQVIGNLDESLTIQNFGFLDQLIANRSINLANDCSYILNQDLHESINILNSVTIPANVSSTSGIHIAENTRLESTGGIDSRSAIAIIAGNVATPNVVSLGEESCAINNGVMNEVLSVKEFNVSQFDLWRFRSLPAGSGNAVVYDPVTSLVSDSGAPPGGALALPTVAGTVYGDAAPTTKLQLGYNTSLTPTTGVNIYASSVSAAQGAYSDFDTPIYISSNSDATGQDVGYISIHNSTNLVHGLGFCVSMLASTPGFTADNSGAVVISALASSLTDGGVSRTNFIAISPGFGVGPVQVANNAIILTNANVSHTCVADEFYVGSVNKWVVEGTIPTAPTAATNLFVRRDPLTGSVTNGELAPLKASLVENDQLLTRDAVSGLVSYNNTARRTFTFQGTTNASGQITQSLASLSLTVAPRVTATAINSSTTVAYTAQINAVSTGSVTIQVFNSLNAVLVSPTMIPAGAGIVVDVAVMF